MHRPDAESNVVELSVSKNRNGPTGTIKLTFRKPLMRFENYAAGLPPVGS
jgi:replicative DNA helicase